MGDVQLGPVTHLSAAQVTRLWIDAGGDPAKAPIATAIVFSSENPAGNAGLVNDTPETGDYSVGLWQINYAGNLYDAQSARFGAPESLAADPAAQARAAVSMSRNGTNWSPWGPDLGYSGYGETATTPLPGSRVGSWLDRHGYGSLVSGGAGLPRAAVVGSMLLVGAAGAFAWWLASGAPRPAWVSRALGY